MSSSGLAPTAGGPVEGEVRATDNIMNTVADASQSLYQICVTLRQRLMSVQGFANALIDEEEQADEDTDPVTLLWRTFRRGYPLMLLYNTLNPDRPIEVPRGVKDDKKGKAATFKFLQACVNDLRFPPEECFIVTDLYGDDTTGFLKVAGVVNRVLDILVHRGLIDDILPTAADLENGNASGKRTQRQHIVHELVTTERTYVQHLQLLLAFKQLVEQRGVIPGDAVHNIFLNLNALLDFQRRFLIRVEQTYDQPEEMQNWGAQFVIYKEAFMVYEPYIANQKRCLRIVEAEFSKLREAGGSPEMRQICESSTTLHGFLMKPFQRLSKYPLLLRDLLKKGDFDEHRKEDLERGLLAAGEIMMRCNSAVEREEKAEAVEDLVARVEDWKGHKVEQFGELLLYGNFTVIKSEAVERGKDGERQYHVFLFETIILCCKDIDPKNPKNKLANRQLTDKNGKPKLQLKGRIFMQNVTDLVSLSKQGSYTCQIFWKGDPSIENFIIRFMSEDLLKRWTTTIEVQRRWFREQARKSNESRHQGISETQFEYFRNQPALQNPYAQIEEDEDDELDTLVGSGPPSWQSYPKSDFSQSRNNSSSSLRSRSTTAESNTGPASATSIRGPTPRFPPGSMPGVQGPLTLRTQQLQEAARSPGERPIDSYFSPAGDSPLSSSRTSSSSNLNYPFPRMAQNGYYEEGHGTTRYTAPAMGRPSLNSREPSTSAPRGSGPTRMHSAQQIPMSARNRSASSPDIHNRLRMPAESQPPMPNMPITYQQNPHMINRSQNNSPGIPSRGQSNSPHTFRERSFQRQPSETSPTSTHTYDGIPSHLQSSQPTSRTITPVPSRNQTFSPPPPGALSEMQSTAPPPQQLKVKVHAPSASQVLTLVVPLNITYQSLKDRIDAKLQRSTNLSLGDRGLKENHVKLKYLDEDDYVSIHTDEDVQTAFETWREQRGEGMGGMGEIELFCQR
ncbi:hypothetical protein K431DRAFT_226965 [Polychaeton citri CBS 116435]|uniref:DH domain-containing protein n=1 Tax=Polychaeton citri CBS 116435 TaxID=1314669 RepID=A0A9P4Q5J7_9PEZI|nr:hypothetical protein K431DRAFT_226965 [Polychaeton citri CBS 116435]